MPPLAVVKKIDILGDLRHRLAPRLVAPMVNELGLQGAEEALHRGVVVAVAFAAHGGFDTELPEQFLVVLRAVLTASVRVMNQPCRWPFSNDRRHQAPARPTSSFVMRSESVRWGTCNTRQSSGIGYRGRSAFITAYLPATPWQSTQWLF